MLPEYPHPAVPACEDSQTPEYEPPTVLSYSQEELIQELGPVHACSFNGAVVGCTNPYEQWLRDQGYRP
jgi:hypothetical protein